MYGAYFTMKAQFVHMYLAFHAISFSLFISVSFSLRYPLFTLPSLFSVG